MQTSHLLSLCALAAGAAAGHAAPADVAISSSALRADAAAAWTDADYAGARTLMPRVSVLPPSVTDLNAAAAEADATVRGGAAGNRGGRDASHLREQRVAAAAPNASAEDAGGVSADAVGTGGIQFSSSRGGPTDTDTTYPFRAVGKLYFKIGTASYMCSGSMIKPGIVVTAGHCVHSGSGTSTGWYSSFQFIPGYRNAGGIDSRPYGTWTSWASVRTSTDWYYGGGSVPNAHDYAVIVFNKDAKGYNIGNYTGWLGYIYPRMIGRQSTVLGYPANLDAGGILHRTDSLVTDYGSTNNGTWGSDMEGGSSGGPVVQNFQMAYSDTSTLPSENESNRVASVVSWGYVSTTPKVQGGAQFDSIFGTMVTNACTAYPSAC